MNIEDLKSNIEIDDLVEGQLYWIRVLSKNNVASVMIDGEEIKGAEEIVINEAKLVEYSSYNESGYTLGHSEWCSLIFEDHNGRMCEVFCDFLYYLESVEDLEEYVVIRHIA